MHTVITSSQKQSLSFLILRLGRKVSARRRVQFGLIFVLMMLSSLAEVISLGAVLPFLGILTAPERFFEHVFAQPLVNTFSLTSPSQLLLPLTVFFAMATIASAAMRLVFLWAQTRFSQTVGAELCVDIYRRTLYQPYRVHLERNSSEVIAGIFGKAKALVAFTIRPVLVILNSIVMLIAILAALVAFEPEIAVATFGGVGAIYVFVALITKNQLARDGERLNRAQGEVLKVMQEGLGGIRDVLIDGTQEVFCKMYQKVDIEMHRAAANVQIISSAPRYVVEALSMVLIAVLAYYLTKQPQGSVNAIPILGVLALAAQRLLPVLQQAYTNWSLMRSGQASLGDILDLLDQPLPEHAQKPPPPALPFSQVITFHHLWFRYGSSSADVLRDINLTIRKGARIGLIGATGSGKSTLLDIIMGLQLPTEGDFRVDGVAISPQNFRSWQAHIAHVPQAIFLADGTIAENIAFGVEGKNIDLDRVRQAAQDAQMAETICAWEKQYETTVGERGVKLSGGQRQRVGIARALYKKADVIVLDEATSALDSNTENDVMQAIEKIAAEVTLIIVAHRLSTLRNCDLVVELEAGAIKRLGSYSDIVGANG